VVGLPDPRWIEAVTAIVVVKSGATLDEGAVIRHCAGAMAHFKVPKRVVFVDSLPKNPSGKLLKRELRQRYLGGETLERSRRILEHDDSFLRHYVRKAKRQCRHNRARPPEWHERRGIVAMALHNRGLRIGIASLSIGGREATAMAVD
jgi:hypothetical protein